MNANLTCFADALSVVGKPVLGTFVPLALAIFLSLCNSFLATLSFFSCAALANWSSFGSAFCGTSTTHLSSFSARADL